MDMGDVPIVQPMAAAERGPDFAVPDQRPRGYCKFWLSLI